MTQSETSAPRVAIVTGGSRGIGRSVARHLAGDAFSIVISYASNKDEAAAAVAEVEAKGAKALAVAADVADEHAVASLFDQAEQAFGGIDVVVNAAGVMSLAPLADFDLAVLDRMLRTNIRGTFVVNQQAARRLRNGGAIINLSSAVTRRSMPTYSAYTATKGAVDGLTLILARELRGRDITVNAVAPGPTATEMYLRYANEEAIARTAENTPLGRLGTPEDIAEVIAFLAGPGRWVNGQIIYANGGLA